MNSYEKPIAQKLCEHWKKILRTLRQGVKLSKTNPSEKVHPQKSSLQSNYGKRPSSSASADHSDQVLPRATQYMNLRASQQCEPVNNEVTIRMPKSLHYGCSDAMEFRVHAKTTFFKEGRGTFRRYNCIFCLFYCSIVVQLTFIVCVSVELFAMLVG